MKRIASPKLPVLLALATCAIALPALAGDSPSLRVGGDAIGSRTKAFPFDNTQGLGLMRLHFSVPSAETNVRRIGHMVGTGAAHNWLSSDAPMPYHYDVKHYPLPGQVYTAHNNDCSGPCALGIAAPPADHLLVLTGFVFELDEGEPSDVGLTTLAIEPDPDDGKIWVELNDGTDVPYDATVQYSYVPTAHVLDGVIRSGTKNSGSDWRVQFIWPELTGTLSPTLLHGFRVHYTDDVARPLGRLQIGMGGRKATIYFHDLSGDDAFDGSIDIIATNY